MRNPKREQELIPLVEEYIKQIVGPLSVTPILDGINYNFAIGAGPAYVLKINKPDTLARETAGLRIYAANGIPTPEIVHHEERSEQLGGGVLLTRYVPNDGKESIHDYVKMGSLLKRMHEIRCEGVGRLDPKTLKGSASSWREDLETRLGTWAHQLRAYLGNDPLDYLDGIGSVKDKHSLLHGDYHRNNILVKGDQIVAVIDPIAVIGDPLLDIAFTILDPGTEAGQSFLKGYAQNGFTDDEEDRFLLYRKWTALEKIGWMTFTLEDGEELEPKRRDWLVKRRTNYANFLRQYS